MKRKKRLSFSLEAKLSTNINSGSESAGSDTTSTTHISSARSTATTDSGIQDSQNAEAGNLSDFSN